MKHLPRSLAFAALVPAVVACGRGPARTAGACTLQEPGAQRNDGYAAWTDHLTATVAGEFAAGSRAVTIACTLPDGDDQFTLILPNLRRGRPVPTGSYRIRSPYHSLSAAEQTDSLLAWARLRRGQDGPILYTGIAGSLLIRSASGGVLTGVYNVAMQTGDRAIALPGARTEIRGEAASRAATELPVSRTVVGGGFQASRQEADWRGY